MIKAVWDLKNNFDKYKNEQIFDCLLVEFLLSEGRYTPTQELAFKNYKVSSLDELAKIQQEKLNGKPKLLSLFKDVEMPLVAVLWQMEKNGIILDVKKLEEIGNELELAILNLEGEIKSDIACSGGSTEINLNSSKQVGEYLVEKEGVPLGKTATGKYATNEAELIKHQNQSPIIKKILTFRELTKLKSTYVESLISKVGEDGRIHTTYHQMVTNTGRLASSNPNLQNIPVTSEFGLRIKSCFLADKDCSLVSFDYSQQELRILAHMTGEEKLIEAFKNSKDVHKITASQIFHVDYEKVTKDQRSIAKTINFGVIYGMGSWGLSQSLQIPVEEADLFISNFYSNFPKIKTFYDRYFKDAVKNGFAETILGRRWKTFLYPGQKFLDNASKRVLLNYPIQGSAADLMKKTMVEIDREVLQKDLQVKLLLQIHDDLVFEVSNQDETGLNTIIKKIKDIMCSVYPLSVPIEVDVKIGSNWGEMEGV